MTNADRVKNRKVLVPMEEVLQQNSTGFWTEVLERVNVPCGPINIVAQVFGDPQVLHRGMKISVPHPLSSTRKVDRIGNPIKLSKTPVEYRLSPPVLGEHTYEMRQEVIGVTAGECSALKNGGII